MLLYNIIGSRYMNRHVISNSLDILNQAQVSLDALMLLLGDAHDGQLQKIGFLLGSVTRDLQHGLNGIQSEVYPNSQ